MVCDLYTWLGGMLSVVKHQHVWSWGLSANNAGVLGHVSGSIHLTFMVDLNFYLNLATYWAKASKLLKETQANMFAV